MGIGIALLVIGLIALGFAFYNKSKAKKLVACPNFSLAELSGQTTTRCDTEGKLVTPEPLRAPLSGEECLAYQKVVIRHYEETERVRDSDGDWDERTINRQETVSSDTQFAPLKITDGTNTFDFDHLPEDRVRTKVWEEVYSNYDAQEPSLGSSLRDVGDMITSGNNRRETQGYSTKEYILRANQHYFVQAHWNGQTLGAGEKGNVDIFDKSEDERLASHEQGFKIAAGIGGVAALAGIILIATNL